MTEPAPESASSAAPTLYERVVALDRAGTSFVLIVLIEALGSTPQDSGAKMIVTATGRDAGTVGGGRLEAQAIAFAQELLAGAATDPRFVSWTLKGEVGMTCGGSVKLYFEPHFAAQAAWPIVIFGAGHVAQALVRVLLPLPCFLTICDTRAEWLEQLPQARNLRVVALDQPPDLVPTLPANASVLCMTKGHSSDLPILRRALAERAFPFIGVIGSAAKAAVLRRELIAGGLPPERAAQFQCPVGLDFGTNHPHEIALSIAGQLITERDRRRSGGVGQPRAPTGDSPLPSEPRTAVT